MRVIVSGASGLVGSHVVPRLRELGHEVQSLVRRPIQRDEIRWYPDQGVLPENLLAGCNGVVHLSGENIASGRWTAAKKRQILDSRVQSTRLLAECLSRLQPRPQVLVSASAIGFYGDRGDAPLEEDAVAGHGYLADVCRQWEDATQPAIDAGIRVVKLRIGVVLSQAGGALQRMLLPFRMGVGGILGNGKQYMSWITLEDLVGVICHSLTDTSLQGPVNGVAPHPVPNRVFTKALGRALHRPTVFPLPGFVARLMLGEMADELLLASTRVVPGKLIAVGYPFRHAEIDAALSHCLREMP
ncbi:MAG TPA: TIGR01777 family oxidoreductase [Pirellulaceae bacterium]